MRLVCLSTTLPHVDHILSLSPPAWLKLRQGVRLLAENLVLTKSQFLTEKLNDHDTSLE